MKRSRTSIGGAPLTRSTLIALALVIAVEGVVVHLLVSTTHAPHWIKWAMLVAHAALLAGVVRRAVLTPDDQPPT